MSAAHLTIESCNGVIRNFGGNKCDVKSMKRLYEEMTEEQFLEKHPKLLTEDFKTLKLFYQNKN